MIVGSDHTNAFDVSARLFLSNLAEVVPSLMPFGISQW